ncbi:hypothetical protein [Methanomethylophilus alvi]|uniref:hypothetical protein n=1 Tax=Methanomethylophilus alvi TaxID=1291540 RepID=UPI0037DDD05C
MISAHKVLLASVAALMLMASAPYILLADTGEGSTSEDPVEVEPSFSLRYDGGALPLYKEDIVMDGIPMTKWSSKIEGFSEEKVSIEWFKHGTSEKVDPYNDTTLEANYLAGPALAGGYDVLIKYDGQEVYNKYVVIEKTDYVKISQESEFTERIETNNGYDTANYAIVAEMNGKLYAMGYEKSGESHEAEAIEVFANEDGSITLGDTHVLTFIPSKNEFNNSLWDFGTGKRGKGTMLVSGNDIGSFYPPNGTYKEYGITVKFSDGESESFSVGGKMMPSGSVITYNAGKDINSTYLRLVENKDGTVCFTGTSIESDIGDWSPVYFYKEYVEIVEPEFTCIFAGDLNKIYDGTPVTIDTYKDIIISGSYFSWEEVCGYSSKTFEVDEGSALALPYWMKVEDKEGTLWDYSGYVVNDKPTGVISGPKDIGSYILVIKTRNTTSDEFENAVSVKFEITSDHEHTFGDWEKVDDDYHSRSCECGYFEKAEHSWNEGVVTTEPTCTERGVKTYTCGDCGATKTEAIDTVDHTYGPWEKNDENKHKKVCDVCGYTAYEDHSWNEGVVTTEPTCTERGVKTYTCSTCDATKTEIVGATGHSFGDWTEVGDHHERTCSACHDVESGDHAWSFKETLKEATCSETGSELHECSVCHATKTELVPMQEHTFTDWMENDANTHKNVCSICGYVKTESHDWDEGTVTGATCTEDGTITYECKTCDATKTETIEAKGHSFGNWIEVGDHHERTCSNCQNVEEEDHEWGEGKVVSEPTCAERGEKTYTCSTCDATKTEIVGATGHSFGDWTEKDGNEHTRICSKCQTSETEAHSWNNGEITLEPTCTENGTNTYTCTYCGATKTEIVNANGHHLTEWIYFDKDTHRNNCDVCDHFEEGTYTWTTNGPSEDGLTTYICGGCNATKVEATVTAETDGGSATVSGDTISDILSQMEGSADEKRVSIDTAGMGKVVLDQNSVSGLTSADAIVDLTFGEGTLTISKDVLNTVSDGTSPISISMNGVQKEELTDAQKEAVGDGLVFRFEASAGEEKIHELGGTVTVSVKYEPKEGEDVSALKAYYVDDEGELHLVGGYYDGSGHFVFDTDHFSYYVVKGAQENGGGDGGDMTVYVAVAAVAIILLAVLGFVYMRRH